MGKTKQFKLLRNETASVAYIESLTSTQDYLHNQWRELPQFAVCLTDFQEHGRGRYLRTWQASAKTSLLLSILVPLSSRKYGWAALAGALAAREACAQIVPSKQILVKWPNDVVNPQGEKIAGILGEVFGERSGQLFGAIGVGINICQTKNELLPKATSLAAIAPDAVSDFESTRENLAVIFVRELKKYLALESNAMLALLKPHCIDIGQERVYAVGDKQISGTVRGITDDGSLIIGSQIFTHTDMARAALAETDLNESGIPIDGTARAQ